MQICEYWRDSGSGEYCKKYQKRNVICCGNKKKCDFITREKKMANKTEKPKTLHEKLVEIQHDLEAPKNQFNSFGNYKYRSCEDILKALKTHLQKHKLVLTLTDSIVDIGNRVYVKSTTRITDGADIIQVEGWARESLTKKGMDESQITGASSSYARKYALNGLFCIDDTKDADTMDNAVQSMPQASNVAKRGNSVRNNATPEQEMRDRIMQKLQDLDMSLEEVTSFTGRDGKQVSQSDINKLKGNWLSKTDDKVMRLWSEWSNTQAELNKEFSE